MNAMSSSAISGRDSLVSLYDILSLISFSHFKRIYLNHHRILSALSFHDTLKSSASTEPTMGTPCRPK